MSFLSERERQTLTLIIDTLMPSLPSTQGDDPALFEASAVALGVPDLALAGLEATTNPESQAELKTFLRALDSPVANGMLAGQWGRFAALDLDARAAVLRAWANSRWPSARKAFQSMKRLTMVIAYAAMPDGAPNPTWPSVDFPGPPGPQTDAPRPIMPLSIDGPTTLATEVLIIGSGAGGGVVAGELAAAGHEVLVLEKGGYYHDRDYTGGELDGYNTLYEQRAILATDDVSMSVLAGSTLGGGTTVNWTTSLRTPESVLDEWEREYGFVGASGADYAAGLAAVLSRLNVNTDESQPNAHNAALERACRALNWPCKTIPRNVKGCEDCSFCQFGCPFGAKQGTLNTYLQDAHAHGARVVVRAEVERVTHQAGRVTGAVATAQGPDGALYEITIKAKAVVVAAGAIHTPALLLRSGLTNRNIGQHLHLHPVTTALGEYEERINPWQGVPQTRLFDQFADLDGFGYGYRVELAPVPPGLMAFGLPWQSPRQHKRLMQRSGHFATFIILARDRYGGEVRVDKAGRPVLHYTLHRYDARHLMVGLLDALRLHQAGGARVLYSPHNRLMIHHLNGGAGFRRYLTEVERAGLKPNEYVLFSAHQMSSCRIAGDAERGALRPTGESYEVGGLFVADGSVLPTATGVNPMISIMGAAHYIAQHIKQTLA